MSFKTIETSGDDPERPLTFSDVHQAHIGFLWRSLSFLGVPRADLEDVCQDVLTVIHRQLATFDRRAPVRSWILGIARGVMANYFRAQRRKRSALVPMDAVSESATSVAAVHGSAVEAAELIHRFHARLEPDAQLLFLLSQVEQLPTDEIGRELGLTSSTVRLRVRALRGALRQFVEQEAIDG
jgi:RNA polymerase sigma-70 factor, ECF subfamily